MLKACRCSLFCADMHLEDLAIFVAPVDVAVEGVPPYNVHEMTQQPGRMGTCQQSQPSITGRRSPVRCFPAVEICVANTSAEIRRAVGLCSAPGMCRRRHRWTGRKPYTTICNPQRHLGRVRRASWARRSQPFPHCRHRPAGGSRACARQRHETQPSGEGSTDT